ncbi:mannosylglycoprotein endo-beta-mannosidase [Quercus suber]|uniref:Mannosylglycoprotein endo-beta-mannosidase n=1 Tax=Quercus suber TaxID=58331 RepID=A0AAW0LS66_QUESU
MLRRRFGDALAMIQASHLASLQRRTGDVKATIPVSHSASRSAAHRRREGDDPSVALSVASAAHRRRFGDAPNDALAPTGDALATYPATHRRRFNFHSPIQSGFILFLTLVFESWASESTRGFCCGRYLVVAVSLQSLWSLTLAILDAYAILVRRLSTIDEKGKEEPVKIIDPHLVSSFFDDYKRVYLHATTELENRCAWVAECSLNIQVTTGVEGNICLVGHLQTNTCHSLLDHVCNIHFLRLFKVNGQPFIICGGNWILLDGLLCLSREHYETDIKFHANMHFNMTQCWGDGLAERTEFYHYCDIYGLFR